MADTGSTTQKTATLKTVAHAAGVSVSTVSNAYNKPEQLSGELRTRILQIAQELGYAGPNAAARSLRSRRAGAIGILFTARLSYAFSDPYAVGMIAGVSEIAEQNRTGLLLIPLTSAAEDDDAHEDAVQSLETVRQAVVDGFAVYCVDQGHRALDVIAQRGVPVAFTSDRGDGGERCVYIDEVAAMRPVGEHLARLGHRNVAVIADGQVETVGELAESELWDMSRQRIDGLREGLGPEARLRIVTGGHLSSESGQRAAEFLLDQRDRPTAIVCIADTLAFGVFDAMRQRGLTPGRDVSITGFDDLRPAATAGLTTVRQPIREKGRILGRLLLDPDFHERRVLLPTELVVRASTGPAPA